jgi:hypothetical protein
MNNIINSSGVYYITSYNLTSNKATVLSPLNVSGFTTLNNTTCISSLNVSGITTPNNYTIMNSEAQLQPKLLLSGQEYLMSFQTSTDGVALLLGSVQTDSIHAFYLLEIVQNYFVNTKYNKFSSRMKSIWVI